MRNFDLVVIGAGVAGLTAAMHAARCGLSVAVVERMGVGGQIAAAERIENFPGFPQGLSGAELGPLLHEQAEAAGAEFVLDTVEGIAIDGDWRVVAGASETLKARAVIVAAGSALQAAGRARRRDISRARRVALRVLRRALLLRPGRVRHRRRRLRPRRGAGADRARGPRGDHPPR